MTTIRARRAYMFIGDEDGVPELISQSLLSPGEKIVTLEVEGGEIVINQDDLREAVSNLNQVVDADLLWDELVEKHGSRL